MHKPRRKGMVKPERRELGLDKELLDKAKKIRESEIYKIAHAKLLELRKAINEGKIESSAAREEIRSIFGELKASNPDVFDALKTQANEVLERIAEVDGQKRIID